MEISVNTRNGIEYLVPMRNDIEMSYSPLMRRHGCIMPRNDSADAVSEMALSRRPSATVSAMPRRNSNIAVPRNLVTE